MFLSSSYNLFLVLSISPPLSSVTAAFACVVCSCFFLIVRIIFLFVYLMIVWKIWLGGVFVVLFHVNFLFFILIILLRLMPLILAGVLLLMICAFLVAGRRRRPHLHINAKELLAVVFAVTRFRSYLSNSVVSVQLDNSTARSYLAREGGKIVDLLAIVEPFLSICDDDNIYFQTYYLPGKYNSIADDLSRFRFESEWCLSPATLQFLSHHFPCITLDLFASDSAHVCSRYVSRDSTDSRALFTNAYSSTWSFSHESLVLVFPPPSELPRVLNELDCASGFFLVIAPQFPTAHWTPRLEHYAMRLLDLPLAPLLDSRTGRPPASHHDMSWTAYLIRR